MAAKAHILAKAFLGVEMQCARCHDAPYHPFEQKDLFSLAAMLLRNAADGAGDQQRAGRRSGGRKPRVEVTLKPGTKVEPAWPFAELAAAELPAGVLRRPERQPREAGGDPHVAGATSASPR